MLQQKTDNPFHLYYDDILIPTQKNLIIRTLQITDCAQWLSAKQENYHYLQDKEPIWDMDTLTYQAYHRLLNNLYESFSVGNYYFLGIFGADNHTLIGGCEISNVMYWPKQSASIGYWISQSHTNKGYATDIVANICYWAFKSLNLVKIEAGTMISNGASQRVLTKAGFKKEGLSHCYGEINGNFEDHIMWGITMQEVNRAYLK